MKNLIYSCLSFIYFTESNLFPPPPSEAAVVYQSRLGGGIPLNVAEILVCYVHVELEPISDPRGYQSEIFKEW